MANRDKVDEAAERFAKQITQGSYWAIVDHAVELQEQNLRFAEGLVVDVIREMRRQAESNLVMTQELTELAEEQSYAYQTLLEESVAAYMNLLCMHLSPTTRRALRPPRRPRDGHRCCRRGKGPGRIDVPAPLCCLAGNLPLPYRTGAMGV